MLKRVFDITFSALLIILLLPIFVLIAVSIILTSKGTVFFKQKRIGANKKEFYIYKFRTMYSHTPKNVPTHMLENPEKYITPVGRLLRKTSLDELPQLLNIIKGEMSFVGPRPALFNQYDLILLRDIYGINRVKPGITGWAQVNGRDTLDIPTKVEFDRYYVAYQSIWMDIKIIFLTIFNIVLGKGVVEGKQDNQLTMRN